MIVQVRVDDRLIHGQVALVWTKELNTTRIIVANKHAVESDALRMTLSMGTPAGQKLLVKDVPDACRIANDPRADSMRIFALTNCVRDVLELVKGAPGKIEGVNVANVGRFDKSIRIARSPSTPQSCSTRMSSRPRRSFASRVFRFSISLSRPIPRLLLRV